MTAIIKTTSFLGRNLLVRFLLLGLLVSSYNLIIVYFVNYQGYNYESIYIWRITPRPLFSFVIISSFIYLSLILSPAKLKKVLMIATIPFLILNTLLVWLALEFKTGLSIDSLLILKSTNLSETLDFLFLHWDLPIWMVLSLLFFYLWYKSEKDLTYNISRIKIFSISILLSVLTSYFINYSSENNLYYEIKNRYFPISLIGVTKDYYDFQLLKESALNTQKGFEFEATHQISDETEIHILFLGESARADHFGLNGYQPNTTPLLSNTNGIINFNNAAAQASHTMRALPLILTRGTPDNYNLTYQEKSVISAYNEAGFTTSWISSQPGYVFFDEEVYDDRRCYEADFQYFCDKTNCDDIVLVNQLKEQLKEVEIGEKYFFIIHGYGSHTPYEIRYPSSFNQINQSSNPVINHYDNSILYTDYIISEVIKTLPGNASCYLLYTSDHGENLADDSRNLYFHSDIPTSYASHIPFFVWHNSKYESLNNSKIKNLKQHSSQKISNDNVFHTLLDLSNISFPKFDYSKSLCDSSFHGSQQIIYYNESTTITLEELKNHDYKFQ